MNHWLDGQTITIANSNVHHIAKGTWVEVELTSGAGYLGTFEGMVFSGPDMEIAVRIRDDRNRDLVIVRDTVAAVRIEA